MLKRLLSLVVLVMALSSLALPAQAAPGQTSQYRFSGQFADAYFSSPDASGCVSTDVYVFGVDGRVKYQPGRPEAQSFAGLFVSRYDYCTDTLLLAADGYATLSEDALLIDRQLDSATLTATIDAYDYVSGATLPLTIDLAWTGSGDTYRIKDHFQIKAPGFKLNARFDGTFREGQASGTVSDGTTNYTPEPAVFASLGAVRYGEVAISH